MRRAAPARARLPRSQGQKEGRRQTESAKAIVPFALLRSGLLVAKGKRPRGAHSGRTAPFLSRALASPEASGSASAPIGKDTRALSRIQQVMKSYKAGYNLRQRRVKEPTGGYPPVGLAPNKPCLSRKLQIRYKTRARGKGERLWRRALSGESIKLAPERGGRSLAQPLLSSGTLTQPHRVFLGCAVSGSPHGSPSSVVITGSLSFHPYII